MSNERRLQVIIVGSGLAGLTAARILREHHHVTVYERGDAAIATGGQGIVIAPNGVKLLESIGYDRDRAGAVPIYGIRTYDKESNVKEDVDINLKPRFGADCLAQKRSDFRDELMRLATTPSASLCIQGDPVKMVFNTAVVGLDPGEGVLTLSDGSTVAADVVISELKHTKCIIFR
jgi:salicylate hydroxylase